MKKNSNTKPSRVLIWFLGALFIVSAFSIRSQSCFTVSSLAPDSSSEAICTADFNRDGYRDIAIGNFSSSSVSVFLGGAGGNFGSAMNFTSSGNDPRGITSADFNGDSIPDIAVANFYTYDIAVMFGTGTGAFGPATSHLIGGPGSGYWCRAITSADLNGDGKMDIAAAGDAYVIAVFLNTGGGNFGSAAHYLLAANTGPHDIIATDLNNDGILDIATANSVSNDIAVLLGDGTGAFGAATYFAAGQASTGICSADLNGDGRIDLMTANSGSSDVSVLLGTGTGTFSAAVNYTVGANASYVAAADFDGDCYVDMAVTLNTLQGVAILEGDGTGNFSVLGYFSITGAWQICKADFDKDGNMDLAVSTGANVGVLTNCSSGFCGEAIEELSKKSFSVYPNPVTGQLSIKLSINNKKADVSIINALGQIVKQQSFSENIDVSELPPGAYQLKVSTGGGDSYQAKLIKQ